MYLTLFNCKKTLFAFAAGAYMERGSLTPAAATTAVNR